MATEILIIDDNPDIRNILNELISDLGLKTRIAANYQQALAEIDKKLPDVALLDVKLSNTENHEGLKLLDHIKNKNKDITIICLGGSIYILSGYEKKTPEILNLLNLEWLWRLKFDTKRRILRLIETSYLFTKMLIFKQNKIH